MADDSKLSALTELAVAPATDDEIYIRDISEAAVDESKRITWSNLFLNADLPGTLDVTGSTTLDGTLSVAGVWTACCRGKFGGSGVAIACTTVIIDRDFTASLGLGKQLDITGLITESCGGGSTDYVRIHPQGVTITSGATHARVSSLTVEEPIITETCGSVTEGSTLYIKDAPTEGCTNFALHVDDGATQLDGILGVLGLSTMTVAGLPLDVQNTTDAAANQVAIFRGGNRSCPADNDNGYFSLMLDDSNGLQTEFARITWRATDVSSGNKNADFRLCTLNNGSGFVETFRTGSTASNRSFFFVNSLGSNVDFEVEGSCNPRLLITDSGLDVVAIGGAAVSGKILSVYGDLSIVTGNRIELGAITARAGCCPVNPTNALNIFNGTIPVGTLVNGATLYTKDVCCTAELHVMDEAGNESLLSPHCPRDNSWVFHSRDIHDKVLHVDMEKMMKAINDKFGWDFVKEYICPH